MWQPVLFLKNPSSMANLSIRNGKHLNNFRDILEAADLRHYCDDVMPIVRVRGRFVDVCPDNVTYACDCASPWSFFSVFRMNIVEALFTFSLGALYQAAFFFLSFFIFIFSYCVFPYRTFLFTDFRSSAWTIELSSDWDGKFWGMQESEDVNANCIM